MAVVLLFRMAQQLSDAVPKGSLLHQTKLSWDSRRGLVLGVYVCAFVCTCICACVYLCVYVCTCVYMCSSVHVYIECVCMCICAGVYLCVYMCACVYMRISVHVCVFVSMCIHVFLYMQRLKVDVSVFLNHFPLQVF